MLGALANSVATLRAAPDPDTVVSNIEKALGGRHDVLLGGADVASVQTGKQAQSDLGFAEAIAFPLLAVLAFFIFRGIAALPPIAVGGWPSSARSWCCGWSTWRCRCRSSPSTW
jgi:uncharacterized membrane protein YdfJ with MMPL/SSD domain